MARLQHTTAAVAALMGAWTATLAPMPGAAAADTPAPPAIDPGGVLNAASRLPASLPGGAIARGSRFTLSGVRLGPETAASTADVAVRIEAGGTRVEAPLFLVSAERIDGLIPATVPPGPAQLTVSWQGRTSEPYNLTIVPASFGFFTSETAPAGLGATELSGSPGERVTLWGTGLGGSPLELFVGGRPARAVRYPGQAACCAGVDRVEFEVPADAPPGCSVPVQARGPEGRVSNSEGIAIHAPGEPCRDQVDWFHQSVAHATSAGFVVLARVALDARRTAGNRPQYTFDYGIGSFGKQEAGQRPLPPIPPANTCTLFTDRVNLRQLLGEARSPAAWMSVPKPLPGNRHLEAGPAIVVHGPAGTKQLEHDARRHDYYNAILGGGVPFSRAPATALFLKDGGYTISAAGGEEIGGFAVKLAVPRPILWKNRERIEQVDRSAGVTLEWQAARKQDAILIAAASADHFSGDSAMCVCMARAADGRFTIPALSLANLPPTGEDDMEPSYLMIAEIPADPPVRIEARGLDAAFAAFVSANARLVKYK